MKKKAALFRAAHPYFICDAVAAICWFALFLYFILTVRRGIGVPDELYHFSIPFRVLQGDAFLVHDWSVEQISQLINIIPYWLYVKITGSTEGLLLAARYFFIVVDACVYIYMYMMLRKKIGFWGIPVVFLFCGMLPPIGLSLYYYSVGTMTMAIVCLMLLLDAERKSAGKLFVAGFVWGIAILEEPMTFLICVLYVLVVLVHSISKNRLLSSYSFIISPRPLGWLALGAFTVLLLFVFVVWITGGTSLIKDTIPYFLNTSGYSGSSLFDFWKIPDVIRFYGLPGILLGLFSLGMAFSDRFMRCKIRYMKTKKGKRREIKRSNGFRIAAFAISCFGFALCGFWALRSFLGGSYESLQRFFVYQNFPLPIFSLIWILLCKKKEPNVILIWWMGTLFSLFADISSDVMLGVGGPIALLGGGMGLQCLLSELKEDCHQIPADKKVAPHRFPLPVAAAVAVLAISTVLVKGAYIASERMLPWAEYGSESFSFGSMCAVIQEGPCKGVVTTEHVKAVYDAMLRDLALIKKENTTNEPVMVAGVCPAAYLYLGFPVGCLTEFYQTKDYTIQWEYWAMFPQKIPGYIYVPDYSYFSYYNNREKDKRIDLSDILPAGMEYEATEVETGRIIQIRQSQK